MGSTVRTKVQKKQPALDKPAQRTAPAALSDIEQTRRLEQAVMDLEDAVHTVLQHDKGHAFHDVEFLYWNRKLKSAATQISLALAEYRGPRRFHYHYRHDPKDYDALYPVAGPAPMVTLTRVCREALTQCSEMVGIGDRHALSARDTLEQALRLFISRCGAANGGAAH